MSLTERPFVGRAAERQTLAAHLAAASAGSGRVVLVSGEPGIGKTRLVEEAVAAIERPRVLWGRCHEADGAPAFWPWIQALRDYVRSIPDERLGTELGDSGPELARLVPTLRSRCPGLETPGAGSTDADEARFRLFDAVTMFLRRAAADEVRVIVLDDLQWADSESLLLLAFVARELRGVRLLLLGTYREVEIRQTAAAARVLGDLVRSSHHVALAGLTVEDVRHYVTTASRASWPAETVAEIQRVSDGNAFFVTEIVQLLLSEGRLDASAAAALRLAVPHGLREVIRRRIEPLSAAGRRILSAAAILGREFDIGVLRRMSPIEPDSFLQELDAATRLGAIVESADRPGEFRFAHALLRGALVGELDAAERAELHRTAGAALEEVHGAALDGVLGEIAHHYLESAALGTLPKAIEFATRAGQRAYDKLGYEEAAGHYERALQASRTAAIEPGTRLRILLPLGQAQEAAGDTEGARATLLEAAQLARDVGDARTFALAATFAGAAGAETGAVDWTLVRLLEEAVELNGPASSRRRSFLLATLSRALYFSDAERRHALSAEAVAIARQKGDAAVLLWALQARQLALWEPGEAAARREVGVEVLALASASRQVMGTAQALTWQIVDHLELGEIAVVRQALRRYRELAASCRLPRVRWHVTVVEAALAHLAGRLEDARRLARRAVGLLSPSRRNNVATFFGVQSFLIREEEGRLDEIESLVATAAEQAVNLPIWRAAIAVLHANLGRTDAARQVLGEIAAAQFADLPRDGNLLGTYARLAEACSLADAAPLAEPLLQLLAPHAGSVVVLATAAGCLGSAARYVGLLAHLLGRLDDAIGHFDAALGVNQRIGALPQLAHTQRELARSLRARGAAGDRERADGLEARARAAAARLGLVTLGRRLDAGDRSPGIAVELPRPQPIAATARTAVLRREGDFWTVACGDESTRIKDTKGVAYLAELLRHPGQELHALELGGAAELRAGDAGEALDAEALGAYRARITELNEELVEAETFNDIGRVARIREEMDMLGAELTRASGLGGRVRKVGSDTERARLNVTRAVRKVVRKILADCPLLGHHLDRSVKTGLFCGYEPDPAFPIEWGL